MKKRVLFSLMLGAMVIALASVFCSCDSKKEAVKVGPYEQTEVNGKFGIKDADGHVVLAPEYDKLEWRADWDALIADKGDLSTIVVNGSVVLDGVDVSSFEPVEGTEYVYIKSFSESAEGSVVRLWKVKSSYLIGPFNDIKLIGDIVFMNTNGDWGAATLDHNGLAPRKYERIIIVKTDKTRAVLVKDKSGWAMFDKDGVSDGVRYDTPSKVLEKQIKQLGVDGEIAVVDVNWNL